MADPSRPLTSPDDTVSPSLSSASRRVASPRQAALNLFRGNSGYQRMPSDGDHEMVDLDDSGPSSYASGLGISMRPGPPPASRSSPPETPRSHHGLLGSTSSVVASSNYPPEPYLSPNMARTSNQQGAPEPFSEIWTPAVPHPASSLSGNPTEESHNLKDSPNTQARGLSSPASNLDGQSTPTVVGPRGEVIDDDFDDDTFYKKFGKRDSSVALTQSSPQ
jgi:hypothetical protein